MKYFQTKLVDSRKYKQTRFASYSCMVIGVVCQFLAGGRRHEGPILEYGIQLFFDSPVYLNYVVAIMSVLFSGYGIYLAFVDHSLGVFRLSTDQIVLATYKLPIKELKFLRLSINSPQVFGTRSAKTGFNNWVELYVNGEERKFEFYLENSVMEDSLIAIVNEIRQTTSIPIKLNVNVNKPKESVFESWFGNG